MRDQPTFTAIVLAGDRTGKDPARGLFGGRKALLRLAGRPMVGYVLAALSAARAVGDIFVVANRAQKIEQGLKAAGEKTRRARFIEGTDSPVKSVIRAIEQLKLKYPVLVVTGDNPLLTTREAESFCRKALAARGFDVAVAVAEKSRLMREMPEARRTFVPLKGDAWGGCNMFALLNESALNAARFWIEVERNRKKTVHMVAALGLPVLFGSLTRTLSLEEGFRKVSARLGARILPLPVDDIRVAMDVDKPADAAAVEAALEEKA